jgi:hypothetical protein
MSSRERWRGVRHEHDHLVAVRDTFLILDGNTHITLPPGMEGGPSPSGDCRTCP